jgi:2-dehydro-3-deoxygluconokinase
MSKKIVTFGEVMVRLNPPGFERFFQTSQFEAYFGGGEANVAVSLAQFGLDVEFVTSLPENPIAEACIEFLRGKGVNTNHIHRGGERMGIYFLEVGANQRSSNVVYDRSYSSISTIGKDDLDWNEIFSDTDWFHITGITPAISANAADISLSAVKAAKNKKITVSCDYNFRSKLWKYGKSAPEIMRELVKYVDVGIANEEDIQRSLGISIGKDNWEKAVHKGDLDVSLYEELSQLMFKEFPNLKYQAITLRESLSASHNRWSACLANGKDFYVSPLYNITNIVDRVGGGDSFSAGLIFGLISDMKDQEALDFATAASCLKHSIPGDMNLSTFEEVNRLAQGDQSGRVRR